MTQRPYGARDGVALAYASEELRGDAEVLAAAAGRQAPGLRQATESMGRGFLFPWLSKGNASWVWLKMQELGLGRC